MTRLPLSRRTRIRLAVTRRIDIIAIWLIDNGHTVAAVQLWRASGLWNKDIK